MWSKAVEEYYNMSDHYKKELKEWLYDNYEISQFLNSFNKNYMILPRFYQNEDLSLTMLGRFFVNYYVEHMKEMLLEETNNPHLLHKLYIDICDQIPKN